MVFTAIRDKAGNLSSFLKVTRDLTERKQSEDAIRQLNEELEDRFDTHGGTAGCRQ